MREACPCSKPVLAFTCGDPAGIGPETIIGALRRGELSSLCRPLLVGELAVWKRAGWRPGLGLIWDTRLGLKPPPYGRPTRDGGLLSFAAVAQSVRLAGRGLARAVVTGPIAKEGWAMAAVPWKDHTEYLRGAAGSCRAEMILGCPSRGLWCVLVTRHVPLARVPGALSVSRVVAAARTLERALRRLGRRRPKLLLCGLNPHAGEGGMLGREESRVLVPAMRAARRFGLDIAGPAPADAAWRRHIESGCHGLVCLYHDQALIGLKAAAGLEVVNWTAGLPFARVSPGHGTGFDIAGKGKADPSATVAAALLAVRLSNFR